MSHAVFNARKHQLDRKFRKLLPGATTSLHALLAPDFSALEVHNKDQLYCAGGDIDNAFYRIQAPDDN